MVQRSRHDTPDPAHASFMTGRAPSWQHPGGGSVNHFRSREGRRGEVAALAGGTRWEVVRRFAHNADISPAMTRRTTRHDSRMVICSSRERGRGLVACLARRGCREVRSRFAYDARITAAMTDGAAGDNPRVVHRRSRPKGRRRLMARLAPHRGWNMGRGLA